MEKRNPFGSQTQPEWFIAVGEKSVGPITAAEVHERVIAGDLTWISYVWKDGMSDWARICDVPAFQAAIPPKPSAKPQATPPNPPAKKIQPKEWFLYYNEAQQGPYTEDEILGLGGIGKITSDAYAWKDGMADWEKIGSLSVFSKVFKTQTPAASGGSSEKRAHSRKPILAKVMIAEGDRIMVGMARDISIGGMQVLADYVPSKTGARLKLNISPPEITNSIFQPFVAEGVVVRLHEDRRGFSFRFDELSASARQIIERVIA